MSRLRSRRLRFAARLMATLVITMVVVGLVQYGAADRALTRNALAELVVTHESDAKVVRSLYDNAAGGDRLDGVRELLNHVATRPGVLRVALVGADGVVVAVGHPGHSASMSGGGSMPAMGHMPGMDSSAPAMSGTTPARSIDKTVEPHAAATIARVTKTGSPESELARGGHEATVTVPVALGRPVYGVEIVRSTAELRRQVSTLRLILLGTLALGLPFALVTFYLLGARRFSTHLDRALEESATDALTGLRNHREFHEELHRRIELARRHGRPLSVALIDLDGFKQVNDSRGHRAGDRVLASVGLILRQGRPEDLPFRIGGDEFAVLLPETDIDGASTVTERIRHQVDESIDGVTTSIGLASFAVHAPDVESLLHAADTALYDAKRGGRNRVVRADAEQEELISVDRT